MKNLKRVSGLKRKTVAALFLACLSTIAIGIPSHVFAHKVSLFAWVEGDTVYTQSSFFGGKKIQHGTVEVFDASGKRLIQGKTNDDGEFSFKAPEKAAMKIVVSAGMGHQAAWNLKASDFESIGEDAPSPEPAYAPATTRNPPPASSGKTQPPLLEPPAVSADDIRLIVEKTLDKKLAPVLKMLSESRERASIGDILGGIGYIIGLVGLAAYVNGRKKKGNDSK